MQNTPKSLRLQIAIFGRVNAGKSSFLNLVTGQETAITSDVAGTTTDVVEKAQELLPIGPVLWLDTAGFGDETELSEKRLAKTARVLERADVAIMVCEGDKIGNVEKQIIALAHIIAQCRRFTVRQYGSKIRVRQPCCRALFS